MSKRNRNQIVQKEKRKPDQIAQKKVTPVQVVARAMWTAM